MPPDTLEQLILALLQHRAPEHDFAASADHVADGLLDSFDLITLTTELEDLFGIDIPGEAVLPEHFANAGTMARLVGALMRGEPVVGEVTP